MIRKQAQVKMQKRKRSLLLRNPLSASILTQPTQTLPVVPFSENEPLRVLRCSAQGKKSTLEKEWIEILFVTNGCCDVICNQQKTTLRAGDLILCNAFSNREILSFEPQAEVYQIEIDGKKLFDHKFFNVVLNDNVFASYVYKSIYVEQESHDYMVVKNSGEALLRILRNIVDEYYSTKRCDDKELYSWLVVLFLRLYDCRDDEIKQKKITKDAAPSRKSELVADILHLISEDVKNITLSTVAKKMHLHPNYICKIIKDVTSSTFTEIVNVRKTQQSMRLLEGSDLSLENVAEEVGYNNASYFYRVFKNHTGDTPGQYRKRFQEQKMQFSGTCNALVQWEDFTSIVSTDPLEEEHRKLFAGLKYLGIDPPRIAFFPAAREYNYIMSVERGLASTAQKLGATVDVFAPSKNNVNEQISLLNQALTGCYDALLINTHDENAIVPALKQHIRQGTLVGIINSDNLEFPLLLHTTIGYRQRMATYEIGRYAIERMAGMPAKVGIIQGITGYHSIERCGGFLDAIQEAPSFDVVSVFNGNWNAQGGYEAAVEMFRFHPEINVLFCANDHEASGVVKAIHQFGKHGILLLSNDGDIQGLRHIVQKEITATVGTNPYEMGSIAAQEVIHGLRQRYMPRYVETPTQIVDQSNAQVYLKLAESYDEPITALAKEEWK